MDKNEFLLLSEVLYQLHACQTMASLERNFFHCLSLFIPFRYASYIEICPQGEQRLRSLVQTRGLTRREEEILRCFFQGMDNAEICRALRISKNTLYKHNNIIFQKCGVKSRWELLKLRQ